MGAGDLAPHDSDLGAADLLGSAVDESDLLAEVEAGGLGVVDTLNLDQAGVGVGVALASLVAEVTSPVGRWSIRVLSFYATFRLFRCGCVMFEYGQMCTDVLDSDTAMRRRMQRFGFVTHLT